MNIVVDSFRNNFCLDIHISRVNLWWNLDLGVTCGSSAEMFNQWDLLIVFSKQDNHHQLNKSIPVDFSAFCGFKQFINLLYHNSCKV